MAATPRAAAHPPQWHCEWIGGHFIATNRQDEQHSRGAAHYSSLRFSHFRQIRSDRGRGWFLTHIFSSFYTSQMKSQFRTALMWLLLLALPLQGFAAATMLNCGPNHHRMLSATAVKAPSVADVDAMVGHHGHSMDMAGDHHDMVADAGSNDMPSVHHLDKLTKFKCSACAACCMGAALPTAPLVFTSFPPAMTTAAVVSTPHADFLSGGLDRPPRLPLV